LVKQYQLETPVGADKITEFCQYLECKFGSEIRYEHSREKRTTFCRLKLVGTVHHLSIPVEIVISFEAPWNHCVQHYNAEVLFSKDNEVASELTNVGSDILEWIECEIKSASNNTQPACKLFTIIERFVASPRSLLNAPVKLTSNITALPTVLYNNGLLPIGALKCTIRSYGGMLAANDTSILMNRAMDILVFALGAQENWRGPVRGIPDECKGPSILQGAVRSLRRIYVPGFQPGSSMPGLYAQSEANTRRLAELAKMLQRIPYINDKATWNALAAYRDGSECNRQNRAIYIVAYMSALAAFCSKQTCPGKVTCDKCGPLSFPHDIIGERKAVENLVLQAHSDATNETKKDICRIIKQAHRAIRSGYVHTASPMMETGRTGNLVNGLIRPGPEYQLVNELEWQETLAFFPSIARRTILWEISRRTGLLLDSHLWGLEMPSNLRLSSTLAVRIGAGYDWLYIRGYN